MQPLKPWLRSRSFLQVLIMIACLAIPSISPLSFFGSPVLTTRPRVPWHGKRCVRQCQNSKQPEQLLNVPHAVRAAPGLGAIEVKKYLDAMEESRALFKLIKLSFTMDYDRKMGITKDDLPDWAAYHKKMGNAELAEMLESIVLVGEGCSVIHVASSDPSKEIKRSFVVYARRGDGRYDVVVAHGVQTKAIAAEKVAACLGGSLAMGGLGGCMLVISGTASGGTALLGAGFISGVVLLGSCAKAAYDYSEVMECAVTGYILKEMQSQNILVVSSNNTLTLTP